MEQPILNLDVARALDDPIVRVIRPEDIQVIQEAHAEDNPQIQLPLPAVPVVLQERAEQAAAPNTEDTSLDLVMAHATDFQMFRDNEGYRFGRDSSDSDSDVPEDYSSESEDEAQEAVPTEEHTT